MSPLLYRVRSDAPAIVGSGRHRRDHPCRHQSRWRHVPRAVAGVPAVESAVDVRCSIRCRFSRRAAQQQHPINWHLSPSTPEGGYSSNYSLEKGWPYLLETPGPRLLFQQCPCRRIF